MASRARKEQRKQEEAGAKPKIPKTRRRTPEIDALQAAKLAVSRPVVLPPTPLPDTVPDMDIPKAVRYYRKVIRIRAEDSPNVRIGIAQRRAGLKVTGETALPGVLGWHDYLKRRAIWDKILQSIGLDAQFYEGGELLLYPPEWLNRAERVAREVRSGLLRRQAEGMGVDPAEGGDQTAMCVVDRYGVIDFTSKKTPNTADVTAEALAWMRFYNLPPERVFFDRGGGGKQHADRLREQGYEVRTVAFGEAVTPDPKQGYVSPEERMNQKEEKTSYVNRRAEMYGRLRDLLDPSQNPSGFGIPTTFADIRRQLAVMPKLYDKEGRMRMLAKNRTGKGTGGEKTLTELLGCSPDAADALVLAVYAMAYDPGVVVAGAMSWPAGGVGR